MIRWKYVAPRLVVLAGIAAALAFGLDPLLKWSLIAVGQSLTGARVGIGQSRVSWSGTKVRLARIEVADPGAPQRNLLQADDVVLDVDGSALSRRKFVVDRGAVRGLRFAAQRDSSGALEEGEGAEPSGNLGENMARRGQQWLDNAVGLMQRDLEEELESVRLSQELAERWPREYDRLQAQADALQQRVERLRQVAETTRDPLQAIEAYPQVAADLQQIRRELLELPPEANRLHQQVQQDKQAIAEAKRRDVETLKNKLRLENLDGQKLSEYLLGPNLGPPIASVVSWLHWGHKHLPSKPGQWKANRGRGETVVFPGTRPIPDYLVRTLDLQGEVEMGHGLVPFQGTATGLTTQQALSGMPLRLRVQTGGTAPATVQAVLDRRHSKAHDQLIVDCPAWPQPAQVLGDPDRLAVKVSPGQAHAWTSLEVRDEALDGEIVFQQAPVQLVPLLGQDLDLPALSPHLHQVLEQVHSLEVLVDVSGTLDRPQWKLRSNLGEQLSQGINQAVGQELAARTEQLVDQAQRQVTHRVDVLEEQLMAKHQAVLRKVQWGDAEVQRLIRELAAPVGVSDRLLGRDSPLRAILRR
jgi:uncharacterized protein (TIGR03545 family)